MPVEDKIAENTSGQYPEESVHVLFVPAWYPNKHDIQNGSFVRKHALAASTCSKVSVMFIKASDKTSREIKHHENLAEYIFYFRRSKYLPVTFYRYLETAWNAFNQIKEERGIPDLINLVILRQNILPALALAAFWRKPYMVTEHWSGFISGKFDKQPSWKKKLHKRIYKNSEAIAVVSETLEKAMKRNGIEGKFSHIPNIISQPPEPVSEPSSNTFLVVADLVEEVKNISGVLHAFNTISQEFSDARLIIAGGGEDEAQLKKLAVTSKSKEKITFTGRVSPEEATKMIASAGCIVVNSFYETFSMVAAEALAAGTPLICTRCGGPEEFLTDETALMIDTGNQEQLELAMRDILSGKKTFSSQKMREAVREFKPEKVGMKLCTLFKYLAGE